MEAYQQRVMEEQSALHVKITKLSDFLVNKETFRVLDPEDQVLLHEQLGHMQAYDEVLRKRIARFK